MDDILAGTGPEAAMTTKWTALRPDLAHLWDPADGVWTVKELDGLRVAVLPLLFTAAVIIGETHRSTFYVDRWCYESVDAALAAARAWAGPYPGSEPEGWHRHPASGRRRHDGDPAREAIAP